MYFPEQMIGEMQGEATRTDNSLSRIVQEAWKIARERVSKLPAAVNDDDLSS